MTSFPAWGFFPPSSALASNFTRCSLSWLRRASSSVSCSCDHRWPCGCPLSHCPLQADGASLFSHSVPLHVTLFLWPLSVLRGIPLHPVLCPGPLLLYHGSVPHTLLCFVMSSSATLYLYCIPNARRPFRLPWFMSWPLHVWNSEEEQCLKISGILSAPPRAPEPLPCLGARNFQLWLLKAQVGLAWGPLGTY